MGKTHLAAALLRYWIGKGKIGLFVTWDDLHRQWLNEFQSKEVKVVHYSMSNVPLLVIDDVGSKDGSESYLSFVQDILSSRWTNRRPTIITTNKSPSELESSLGEAIWSRLKGIQIVMSGYDHREMAW